MKKCIILLLVLIMTVSMAISVSAQSIETNPPVPEYTEPVPESAIPETTESMTRDEGEIPETGDSLNISPDEIGQLVIKSPNYQVIKKYIIAGLPSFAGPSSGGGATLEEIISKENRIDVRYMILDGDEIVSYQRVRNGKTEIISPGTTFWDIIPGKDIDFVTKLRSGKEFLSKISADIEVNNSYLLRDPHDYGLCIYYKTNCGDYVYYKGRHAGKLTDYLFPHEDFVKIMTTVIDFYKKQGKVMGGIDTVIDNMDLSNYDINSSSFDLKAGHDKLFGLDGNNESPDTPAFFENKVVIWGSAAAAAALLVAVVVIVTVRVKKKK